MLMLKVDYKGLYHCFTSNERNKAHLHDTGTDTISE